MTRDSEKTAQADFPERREEARGLVKGGETRSEGEDAQTLRGGAGEGTGAEPAGAQVRGASCGPEPRGGPGTHAAASFDIGQ